MLCVIHPERSDKGRNKRWALCRAREARELQREFALGWRGFSTRRVRDFYGVRFFSHSTSSFHPWKAISLYSTATYTQFYPHRRFCWCFSLFYNFCCFYFHSAAVQPAFDSVFLPPFFRGEIIHQFLFSLHSCANNDRKKLLSLLFASPVCLKLFNG